MIEYRDEWANGRESRYETAAMLRARLKRGLVQRLIQVINAEHAASRAKAYLQDLGVDGCAVCEANARRRAWTTRRRDALYEANR